MEKQCKELIKLLNILKRNDVIYISREEGRYLFREYRDNKLFFLIPKRANPNTFNSKSITAEQFCKLLQKLLQEDILYTSDFPFKDCRISAFYGFVNLLYPGRYKRTKGKISKKLKL